MAIKESPTWGRNSLGHAIVKLIDASTKPVGYLPADQIPTDENGVMVLATDLSGLNFGSVYDEMLARTNSPKRASLIYNVLPRFEPFGKQIPVDVGVYYDSRYVGNDSDGTKTRPYNKIQGKVFNTPLQRNYFARGSFFIITEEEYSVAYIRAEGISFQMYGDNKLPPPVITGLKEVTGFVFNSTTSEWEATFAKTIGASCMAITRSDMLPNVFVNGTAGSLTTGQAAWSGNKIYMKDDPGTNKVFASIAGNVLSISANGFRMDGVHVGYTHNHAIQILPTAVGGTVTDSAFRDTATWFGGNAGISLGDTGKFVTHTKILRHRDVGSFNNGINAIGDDSFTYVLEADCTGKLRRAGEELAGKTTGGYKNDAITAHGTGLGGWFVMGCIVNGVRENAIDIIGGALKGHINIHKDSLIRYNRINGCGQSGILCWSYGAKASGNDITDCGQDGIRMGNPAEPTAVMNQECSYNRMKDCCTDTNLGGASGVGVAWSGVDVHHNTIVITARSTRSAHGALDVNQVTDLQFKDNLYITYKDTVNIIHYNDTTTPTRWLHQGNVYVMIPPATPAATPAKPFKPGGGGITYEEWQATREKSARKFVDLASAGIEDGTYALKIDSPLAVSNSFSVTDYDLNGRYSSGYVGAAAVAEV